MRRLVLPILVAAILAAASLAARRLTLPGSGRAPQPTRVDTIGGPTMGGSWSVRFPRPVGDEAAAAPLTASVQADLDRLEGQLSTWRAGSDLSRFNASTSTDWLPVSPDLAAVAAEARRASSDTGGAFDVTVKPAVDLWGFGPAPPATGPTRVPSDAAVDAARSSIDYRRLDGRTSPPGLRKARPDVTVDLSAIGKGFAADRVAAALTAAGRPDHLIAVGGEVRAGGSSAGGRPWRVGVEVPTPTVRRVLCRVELPAGTGLSTSGDYRNAFEVGGRRYAHEIDPRSGRPAAVGRLASVSVIDPSSARADALATGLFVLGPDVGFVTAEGLGLAALFVLRGDGKFELRATEAFARVMLADGSTATVPTATRAVGPPLRRPSHGYDAGDGRPGRDPHPPLE